MKSIRTFSLLALVALLASLVPGCAEGGDEQVMNDAKGTGDVRRPVVAGAFYPGDAATLARDVDGYLASAGASTVTGDVVAIVSPHAGYVYSGPVAAHSYAALAGRRFDTVIVVAPSHRVAFPGASVFGGHGYATPLGVVPVDRELADAIRDADGSFVYEPRAHEAEHSLEVQVPFLQRTLGEFEIVPIVMGDQAAPAARALAAGIAAAVERAGATKRVLLVASTDLSHFHDDETARRIDARVLEAVGDLDPEGLLRSLASGECEACGGGPTATVMMAARELGADSAEVVSYGTSGDTSGDKSRVVGYMAAVLTRTTLDGDAGGGARAEGERGAGTEAPVPYEGLSHDEKVELLRLARLAIERAIAGEPPPTSELPSSALDTPCGAFVTLNKQGRLRGCIGHIVGDVPLRRTVGGMAVEAALRDPRFPPVSAEEIGEIELEISVLSPLIEVTDVSEIEVGRDGLIIQEGARRGLLLPQVATEYGWDRESFLDHTCRKAGLPAGRWREPGVHIARFTAEVFGERDVGVGG